jgi:DnaJ-class molecular chaperone
MIDLYDAQDRYRAAGMKYPDPETVCKSCDGMGFTPTMEGTTHCDLCNGTGDKRAKQTENDGADFW